MCSWWDKLLSSRQDVRSTWKHAVALGMKCEDDSQVRFIGSSCNLDWVLVQIKSSYSTHSPKVSICAVI